MPTAGEKFYVSKEGTEERGKCTAQQDWRLRHWKLLFARNNKKENRYETLFSLVARRRKKEKGVKAFGLWSLKEEN